MRRQIAHEEPALKAEDQEREAEVQGVALDFAKGRITSNKYLETIDRLSTKSFEVQIGELRPREMKPVDFRMTEIGYGTHKNPLDTKETVIGKKDPRTGLRGRLIR